MRVKPSDVKSATSKGVDSALAGKREVDETSLMNVIAKMPTGDGRLPDDQLICSIRNLVGAYHRFAAEPALHIRPADVAAALQDLKDCQENLLEKLQRLDSRSLRLLIEAAGPADPSDASVWGLPALGHGLQRLEAAMAEIRRFGTWIEMAQRKAPSAYPGI